MNLDLPSILLAALLSILGTLIVTWLANRKTSVLYQIRTTEMTPAAFGNLVVSNEFGQITEPRIVEVHIKVRGPKDLDEERFGRDDDCPGIELGVPVVAYKSDSLRYEIVSTHLNLKSGSLESNRWHKVEVLVDGSPKPELKGRLKDCKVKNWEKYYRNHSLVMTCFLGLFLGIPLLFSLYIFVIGATLVLPGRQLFALALAVCILGIPTVIESEFPGSTGRAIRAVRDTFSSSN